MLRRGATPRQKKLAMLFANNGNVVAASNPLDTSTFYAPLNDLGNGEVNTALTRGTGSATFVRATGASTTLSTGALTQVASGVPRSNYSSSGTYLGYLAEGVRTNICLQSNALTTAPWLTAGTPSATQNATGPDGIANSAWTLTDDAAGTSEVSYQDIVLTAAAWTISVFVKKTSGAQSSYPVLLIYNAAVNQNLAACTIDTSNGTATNWTAYTGVTMASGTSARCTSFNTDYWRVELTLTGTADTHRLHLFPAATTNATQSTGAVDVTAQGSAVFYGVQVELGAFASSYIPTTTMAVQRNGDVDSYQSTSNIAAAASTVALTFTPTHAPSGTIALWGTYVDASNYTALLHDGTNLIFRKRIAGVNTDATKALTFVSGTSYKIAFSWGAAGQLLYVDGVAGTPHANTASAQVGTTIQIGADGNSLQQPFASIKNDYHWTSQLTAAQHASIST